MSKRPNRYKKKKKSSKNQHINEPMIMQTTTDASTSKYGELPWPVTAVFLFFIALFLVGVYLTQPDRGVSLLMESARFGKEFSHLVYTMAGSMTVNGLLWLLLFFQTFFDDLSGMVRTILLFVFGIVLGVVCKLCGFPDLYFSMLFGGFALAHFFAVKKNQESQRGESVGYYIKRLLFWGMLFMLMGAGLFCMVKEYPYKLHGKIEKVYCHDRSGNGKSGLYHYKQIEYAIAEPDGRMIDGAHRIGHYEVPFFYNGFTNQGNSGILQRQMDKEGKNIWVRGRNDYCVGEMIPLREEYFSMFICFVCFVQTVLYLRRLIRCIKGRR